MEVLNSYQRKKLDENNDEYFYNDPKFVYHLDANFRKYLTQVYKEELKENTSILDLMSSWDSYLPSEKKYHKVIGHGLNKDELEKNKRKLYAGGIGYFTPNGEFDTCIALRTALIKNKKFYVQAGAGVVADSKPEKEYAETVNKAKALMRAVD